MRSGHAGQSHLHLNVLCFSQGGQAELLQKEELQSGVDAANTAAQEYQRSKSPLNCVSPEVLSRGVRVPCVMEEPKSRFCHSSTHPKPISHSQLPGTFGGSRSSPVLKVNQSLCRLTLALSTCLHGWLGLWWLGGKESAC